MNTKAQAFIQYLEENNRQKDFAIKEINNALHTTLFYTFIKITEDLLLKSMVMIDDSQNILFRVSLKEVKNKDGQEQRNQILNQMNQQYPLFKFYYDNLTGSIEMETTYMAHDEHFEPPLIESYVAWIMQHALSCYRQVEDL